MTDFGPHPPFSWSRSRHRALSICPRRYYYRYYGSWKGWDEEEGDPEARRAYRLKKLTGLEAELGKSVHRRAFEVGFRAAQGLELPPLDELLRRTRDELNAVVRSSRDRGAFVRRPGSNDFLRAAWYGDGPSSEAIEKIESRLDPTHRRLREHDLWREVGAGELEVEHLSDPDVIPEADAEVDGVPLYAEPDLIVRRPGHERLVIDWKSGRERDGDVLQVAVYGLYVRATRGEGTCRGRIEYLADGETVEVELDREFLQRAEDRVRESLEEMRDYQSDPAENRPRPKERFPLTENRTVCGWCNFYELCQPELEAREG